MNRTITPITVKLGTGNVKRGFYHDSDKPYTQIQKGKMTYNMLTILSTNPFNDMGMHELTLSEKMLEIQPELSHDDYGYLNTLPSLTKDLEEGELIAYGSRGTKITKLGRLFLKSNVLED